MSQDFNHFDGAGNAVMVDVSGKDVTVREASARGSIAMRPETLRAISDGAVKKGDVLSIARVAGIMAAKRTFELIPLCHPLILDSCRVEFEFDEENCAVEAVCSVRAAGRTGVEMEALTGVTAALLTIYDMCKSADRGMEIRSVRLTRKSGGKSGEYTL